MKLAFFDTKPYDKEVFEPLLKEAGIETVFYDTRICEDDCILAQGCDAVCVFVLNTALKSSLYDAQDLIMSTICMLPQRASR